MRIKPQFWKVMGIVLLCVAPPIASYLTYYFYKPEGRTNYGQLIQPQRSALDLSMQGADGKPVSIEQFRKRFVLVVVADSDCNAACEKLLFTTRQLRTMTGRDRDRVDRLWIIPPVASPAPISPKILSENEGLTIGRATSLEALNVLFAAPSAEGLSNTIWLIDWQGNLMMSFAKDSDPSKIFKDVSKLLRASGAR